MALQRAAADQIRRVEAHWRPPLRLGVLRHCTARPRAHRAISKCPEFPEPHERVPDEERGEREGGLTVGVEERLPALAEALAQGVDRRGRGGVLLLELRHGRHGCRPLASRHAGGRRLGIRVHAGGDLRGSTHGAEIPMAAGMLRGAPNGGG